MSRLTQGLRLIRRRRSQVCGRKQVDTASEVASKEVFSFAWARKPFIATTQRRIRKVNEVTSLQTKTGNVQKRCDIGGLPESSGLGVQTRELLCNRGKNLSMRISPVESVILQQICFQPWVGSSWEPPRHGPVPFFSPFGLRKRGHAGPGCGNHPCLVCGPGRPAVVPNWSESV